MKQILNWQLCLAIWLGIASLSCAQSKVTFELAEDEKLIEFTTDRFTLPNLHVTPDGESIIFDVLGDIYKVPIEGGKAEVLLQDNNWKRAGKLSPDGKKLAYISDESGVFQVWTIDLETQKKRVYPIEEFIHYPLYGYWGLKNELYIPSEYGLYNFSTETGIGEIIRPENEVEYSTMHTISRRMSIGTNGANSYFYLNNEFWRYDIENDRDLKIGEPPLKSIITKHLASPNNKNIVYYKDNDSIYTKQELVSWDVETKVARIINASNKLLYTTSLNYSFDFINNRTIILDKDGEIVRMDIKTGNYEPIPIEVEVKKVIKKPLHREPQYIKDSIITASVLRNPITRKDLDTIYFGAFGKLHSYAKETGVITKVYHNKNRFELSPSLSPDGKYLVYTTWNDTEMGHVYTREIKTGKENQLTKTSGRYINPAWSPDGAEIIFISDQTETKLGIKHQAPGSKPIVYNLDVLKIEALKDKNIVQLKNPHKIIQITPFSVLANRFYPVPTYHNDGKSIYISCYNKKRKTPSIVQVDLDLKKIVQEGLIPFHTDEVMISPDGNLVAFIFDEIIYLSEYPHNVSVSKKYYSDGQNEIHNIDIINSSKIFEVAPSYLYWQDEHTLMWGSAEEVYTYDVRTRKTKKIADIKVQKPRAVPKAQFALTNARIITMNKQDEIIEKGTILIKDNRIEKVGEKVMIPESYKVFDLDGKTIIPGLIDVHAHYHLSPYEFTNQQEHQYVSNLAYGVTTIYDPSVNVLDYREQAQMVETGQLLGPRVFASGNIIMNYPVNYDFKRLESLKDVERIIGSMGKLKVYGPIKEYDIISKNKRSLLRMVSEKYNFTITTHQMSLQESLSRIIHGYTAVEHLIGGFSLYNDVINLIAKSNVNYTPTFIVTPNFGNIFSEQTISQNLKLKKFNGELLYYNNFGIILDKNTKLYNIYKSQVDFKKEELKNESLMLNEIISNGGRVSIGGHGNPLPGIGTHWELWSFTYGGLSEYEVLRAATINGAEKLDLQEELGTIENGKLADLIVLNSSPLDNIYNTVDILYTIQNGNVFESETMKQIHPIKKELQPWGWESSMILKSMENIYNAE